MSTNIKLTLDTRSKSRRKDNTYPIILRITHKRGNSHILLGYAVIIDDWDEKKSEIKKNCNLFTDVKRVNNFLHKKRSLAFDTLNKLDDNDELRDLGITPLKEKIREKLFGKPKRQNNTNPSLEFTKEIIRDFYVTERLKKASSYKGEVKEKKPLNLITSMTMFLDYIANVNVPPHLQRQRTTGHIKSITKQLSEFVLFLIEAGHNIQSMKVTQVTQTIVGAYFEHIKKSNVRPATFNHRFAPLKSFYNFLIDNVGHQMVNPFKNVKVKFSGADIETIPHSEFNRLLELDFEKDCFKVLSTGERKNMYRPWLKHGFRFGLYTGRRREELVMLKWSDIKCDISGKPVFIASYDYKANRLSNYDETKHSKYVFVPVIPELAELLFEMGFEDCQNTDQYILAPYEKISRKSVMDIMSKAFTFYYKKLNTNREVGFKHLRKTYLTRMEILTGNAIAVSGHSSQAVLEKHYIDGSEVAKSVAASRFRIFG